MGLKSPDVGAHEKTPLTLEGLVEDPIGTVLVGTFRGVEKIVRKGLKHPLTVVPALVLGGVGLAVTLTVLATLSDDESETRAA